MSRTAKKAAILLLIPVLLLTLFGVAYSHWDDTVEVNGAISTGVFNLELTLTDYWDIEDTLNISDVGVLSVKLLNKSDGDDPLDAGFHDKVEITLSNVYPDYAAFVIIDLHNTGTIPAYFDANSFSYNLTEYYPCALSWISLWIYFSENGTYWMPFAYLNNTSKQMEWATNMTSYVLEPCETVYFLLVIDMYSYPNPPETLMNCSPLVTFVFNVTGVQAVP